MRNDLTLTIAILAKLGHITKKEAKELHEELEFINIPMEYEGCYKIIDGVFDKLRIGKADNLQDILVDGKTIKVRK